MKKTRSSRRHAIRCEVGITMMKLKTSSMNVLKALYIITFHGLHGPGELVTASERKHQSASDEHGHNVDHISTPYNARVPPHPPLGSLKPATWS